MSRAEQEQSARCRQHAPHLGCRCEPERARLRVAVLLSGGVDSSLALRLLQAAGHAVTAFYLQIWFQEDFRNSWGACPWEEDLAFCRQVRERGSDQLALMVGLSMCLSPDRSAVPYISACRQDMAYNPSRCITRHRVYLELTMGLLKLGLV